MAMRVSWRGCAAAAGVVTAIVGMVVGGCATEVRTEPVTRPDAVLLVRDGLAVEYVKALDRYTFFGPQDGPNLLYVEGLDRAPAPDEAYTFYGGCYTWVGPQKKWVGPEGGVRDWPPDPAMDVGPGVVIGRGVDWFETRTPTSRLGLREVKRFEIAGRDRAGLSYTLENEGMGSVECAPWVNTAVGQGSVVAVRWAPGVTNVWGWNDEAVSRFRSVLEPKEGTGWAVVDLDKAVWEGGGKVWLDSAPEIAIWTDGYWLVRRVVGAVDAARLRAIGEGPVAMYIQPKGEWIVEAELYGPAVELGPGRSVTTTEEWRVVKGGRGDVGELGE